MRACVYEFNVRMYVCMYLVRRLMDVKVYKNTCICQLVGIMLQAGFHCVCLYVGRGRETELPSLRSSVGDIWLIHQYKFFGD
jgi:hypothetical protein